MGFTEWRMKEEYQTDNGGCFVATYKELKELSRLDEEKIKEAT